MDLLIYPKIARTSRIQQTITVKFHVGPKGRAESPVYSTDRSMLLKTVQDFIEQADFAESCHGEVELKFHFWLRPTASSDPSTKIEFLDPNTYDIAANSDVLNV